MEYDLIVIGCGISGLYTTYCLEKSNQKNLKILLLETKSYLGGRLKTKTRNNKSFDVGGVRIHKTRHKRVMNLINELNLDKELVKLPPVSYVINNEDYSSSKAKKFLKNTFDIISRKYSHLLQFNTFGFFLRKLNLYEKFISLWGYRGNVEISQAKSFLKNIQSYQENDSDNSDDSFYFMKNGFSVLIQKLSERINASIHQKESVKQIQKTSDNKFIIHTHKTKYKTKQVICAIPPHQLKKMEYFKKYLDLLNCVESNNYIRIFGEFNNFSKKSADSFHIHNDTVIPQIISRGDGIVQMAYADSILAENLRDIVVIGKFKKLWNIIQSQLRLRLSSENLKWVDYFYWKRGTHFWKPHVNVSEFYKTILQPDPELNLFIIGEAFSHHQAWIEGSLETSQDVIQKITNQNLKSNYSKNRNLRIPKTIPPKTKKLNKTKKQNKTKTKWIEYEGVRYDISKFMNNHPGGLDAISSGLGKDITEIFKSVGHSSYALRILKNLPIIKRDEYHD